MVKAYFTACEQAFPAKRTQLRRLSLALRRGGVEHMEQLCAIQRAGPEKLLEIRSIGAKSLPLIAAVCARYEENKTPSQGGAPLRQYNYALSQRYCISSKRKNCKGYCFTALGNSSLSSRQGGRTWNYPYKNA